MRHRLFIALLFSLAVFAMSGCGSDENEGEQTGADNSPDNTPKAAPELKPEVLRVNLKGDYSVKDVTLRWAAWGGKGGWADATEFIRAELDKTGAYTCRGAVLVKEIGDPGIKYANALILLFDTPGGTLKIGLNNTSWLRLNLQGPDLKPPGGPLTNPEIKRMNMYLSGGDQPGNKVVWARWGRPTEGNHWLDAYSITQEQIAKDGRVQNSTRGFPLEHPVKNRDKYLQALISMGGQVMKLHLWGAWVELSPDEAAQVSPAANAVE